MIVAQPPVWPGAAPQRPPFNQFQPQAYAPQAYAPYPQVQAHAAPQPAAYQAPQAQAYAPQAYAPQPASPGWSRPSAPIQATPVVVAAPPSGNPSGSFVARAAMPDAPRTPFYKLPPPEALGIHPVAAQAPAIAPAAPAVPAAETLDWSSARREMANLGIRAFQFEMLPDGRHRFICALTDSAGRSQQVEASDATESGAVRQALQRASLYRQVR